jgi:hypothetical protein
MREQLPGLFRTTHRPVGLGLLGIVLPGDVLAYRNAWQPYVFASIAQMSLCAQAIDNILASDPQGGVYDIFRGEAQALHQAADGNGLILQWWNKFAGMTDDQIVAGAADILRGHQTTVIEVNRLRNVAIEFGCTQGWPDPPSYFDQLRIIDRIEGLGILAKGELSIAGKAANQFVNFIDRKTNQLADTLTSPWFLGGAVAIGATLLGLAYAPQIKTILARRRG